MNQAITRVLTCLILALTAAATSSCQKSSTLPDKSTAWTATLLLDWYPEPEFGGFYEALGKKLYAMEAIDLQLGNAAGASTWLQVASGKVEFATTNADQVLIARDNGADIVAIFAVYQTSPQGIMVHKKRGFTKIDDVFTNEGTLQAESNTWLDFLKAKFGAGKVTLTAYSGGVGAFLDGPDVSQQCFVTSEPFQAERKGGDPQTFKIADAGYNPYTTVVICKRELLTTKADKVKAFVHASRAGWRSYLDNPATANLEMGKLNKEMDARTFNFGAEAEAPLIETAETGKDHLGMMTVDRWKTLAQQLVDLKKIKFSPAPESCFVDVDKN